MIVESYLCLTLKRITKTEFNLIHKSLAVNFKFYKITAEDLARFVEYLSQDKKNINKTYLFALLKGIGKCDPQVKVSRAQTGKALAYYNSKIANAS